MNKLKPNTKLREIAEKIQFDYNGEVPENASELDSLLIDGKRGTCFKTISNIMNSFKNEEKKEDIIITHDVSRISERLRWTNGNRKAVVQTTLHEKFPESLWKRVNPVLTAFAQDICQTEKPHCFRCPFTKDCKYFNRSLDKTDEENFSGRFINSGLPEYKKKIRNMKTEKEEPVEDEKIAENCLRKNLKPIIRKASHNIELKEDFSLRKHKKILNKK